MSVPKHCPKCGIVGAVVQQGKYQHCTDPHCGAAWPAPTKKAGKHKHGKPGA